MKRCEYCGSLNEDDVNVCTSCNGTSFVWQCINCGSEFKDGRTCPQCSVTVGQAKKTCPRCKASYYTLVCPSCGYKPDLQPAQPVQPAVQTEFSSIVFTGREKNKWVAVLLCFFLGVFGIHKFYEGKIGLGIAYLFTWGFFGIGWLIDLIVLLMKPNPYYV